MNIKQDDLSRADVLAALAVHLSEANRQNPDGLSHALPLKLFFIDFRFYQILLCWKMF